MAIRRTDVGSAGRRTEVKGYTVTSINVDLNWSTESCKADGGVKE